MQAVRHVRDRTHHGWAVAVYQDPETGIWRWYRKDILPRAEDRFRNTKRERVYDQVLAERPVLDAFRHIRRKVEKITQRRSYASNADRN